MSMPASFKDLLPTIISMPITFRNLATSTAWSQAFITALFLVAVIGFFFRDRLRCMFFTLQSPNARSSIPPGRFGWPIIGETVEFALSNYPAGYAPPFIMSRVKRYGTVFKTSILGARTVVSADAELNKYLLQNEGNLLHSDFPMSFRKLFRSSVELRGVAHKRLYNCAVSFLKPGELKENFIFDVQDHALRVLKPWKERGVVYAQDEVTKFLSNIAATKLFSIDVEDPVIDDLRKYYAQISRGLGSLPFDLPASTFRIALKARNNILNILRNFREQRRNEDGLEFKRNDLFDSLLRENADKIKGPCCPEKQIVDTAFSMLFAGFESTSSLLTMTIKFLTENPKALRELQAEHQRIRLARIKDNRKLSWEDYQDMRFTQNVINESLRLTNVAPYIPRKALQDIHFKDFFIPKGWAVLIALNASHFDSKMFPNPLEFNPWRWQESSLNPNLFTPFGGGIRYCAGSHLARLEVSVFLHYLVTLYSWETTSFDDSFSIPTPRMIKGLPIRVQMLEDNDF